MNNCLCEKDGNGIQFMEIFKKRQRDCRIVYLTDYLFYETDLYEMEQSCFVLKEKFEEKVEEILEKFNGSLRLNKKTMVFSVINGGQIFLRQEEILYFERKLRETDIVTEAGEYKIWDKLDKIEKILPKPDFLRCHNSYIVNMQNIREIHKNVLQMRNGSEIIISRGYQQKVKSTLMECAWIQKI